MAEREITITIKGKNLTGPEFDKARKELAGIDDQAKKTSSSSLSLGKAFSVLSGGLAALGVGAAINEFADFTGMLTDMSAKTGIGVEALQRLKYAAEQNGGTLEQVTGAITKLGSSLAGGNESAIGALGALGLKFSDIRNMAPDQAFTTIADAIAKIPDPMAQSKLAMDLFGKSGAELLPMMKGNLSDTAEAADRLGIVLSEEAVRAGDEFGDTLGSLATVGRSLIFTVLEPMIPTLTMVAQWLGEKLPSAVKFIRDALTIGLGRAFLDAKLWLNEFILGVAEGVNKIPLLGEKIGFSAATIGGLRANVENAKAAIGIFTQETIATTAAQEKSAKTIAALNLNYAEHEKATTKAATALQKAHKELRDWNEEVDKQNAAIWRGMASMADFTKAIEKHTAVKAEAIIKEAQLRQEYDKTVAAQRVLFANLDQDAKRSMESQELAQRILFANLDTDARRAKVSLGQSLKDLAQTIPDTLASAFQGGGNFLGAIKSIASQVGSTLGGSIGAFVGGPLGKSVGAALGSLAGPLTGAIAGLFTDKNKAEVQKYNTEIDKVRQSLIDTYGPLDELDRKAQSVGLSFKDAWGHQGQSGLAAMNSLAQEFKKRWDDVNGTLSTSRKELDDILKRGSDLGYTFDESGNLVKVSTEKMREVAQKYGLDLAALGPSFDQADLNTRITDVINGFELMSKGGTSTGTILVGMKDEINQIVLDSIKFKTTIPANMQPWIKNLIDTGQLIDADGQKIKDMSAIQFGEPVQTEFEQIRSSILALIDSIQALVDRIGGIATAAASIPKVPAPWSDWGEPPELAFGGGGGGIDWGGAQAEGGDYMVTRPTLFLAGERGPERAWFSGANRQNAAPAAAQAAAPVNVYILNKDGQARQVSQSDFMLEQQVQSLFDQGRISVPQRVIASRAGR